MSSKFRKDNLEIEMIKRGLVVPDNVKPVISNLIKVLGNDYLNNNTIEKTFGRLYLQNLQSVMLIDHLKDFSDKLPNDPLASEDYISELKVNDLRCIISYTPEDGFEIFSRNESVATYCNGVWTDKIVFIKDGVVTKPETYKNMFNMRFVLDCGVMTNTVDTSFDGVDYGSRVDLLQSVLGSAPEKSRNWQLSGRTLHFKIFDVLYLEKNPSPITQHDQPFKFLREQVTEEEAQWVNKHFSDFLISSGFTDPNKVIKTKQKQPWEKSPAKGIYCYLAGLKDSLKYDIRHLPFEKRRKYRDNMVEFLNKNNLPFEQVLTEDVDKAQFADEMIKTGEEGCILKAKKAPYFALDNRSHRAQFKVKTNLMEVMNNKGVKGDLDAFIIGCNQPKSKAFKNKGLFGALKVAVNLQKRNGEVVEWEIANVSGIKHDDKLKLSYVCQETGEIKIKPEYIGSVIAINGMCMSNKDLKFQHAVLYFETDNKEKQLILKDKNPSSCIQSEEELEKLILVRGE